MTCILFHYIKKTKKGHKKRSDLVPTQRCLTNIKSYVEFQETQNEESHVSHVGVDQERT